VRTQAMSDRLATINVRFNARSVRSWASSLDDFAGSGAMVFLKFGKMDGG